ncbi:MAG: 16S rRNA (cytosine(1402)-N(4))-methyltransferase RsmH [Deltaproteobacteria bacterium]|nr:16S rRNA (cytosine(1402)-N(4))-methyltransferase RsmH [Deltaproteobacteria bacterium]
MVYKHKSVLVNEIISYLPDKVAKFADFTLGGAGHSLKILDLKPESYLFGVDQDLNAIEASKKNLSHKTGRFELKHRSFSEAAESFSEQGLKFDFLLADLGFSSHQIDTANRGCSFLKDGPLDMRMNQEILLTAEQVVNQYRETELAKILYLYGEEKFSRKIAKAIVELRQKEPFKSTVILAECIKNALPKKQQYGRIHPATKTFQALRIEVNQELDELKKFLEFSINLLNVKGRIAIISFHSLEDRLVKKCFNEYENPCYCPKELPLCVCGLKPVIKKLHRKMIQAGVDEIEDNPRSRSAKLRIVEKI